MLHSAFYRFTTVDDSAALAQAVRTKANGLALNGSIVVAFEGISGAVAGPAAALDAFELALQQPGLLRGALKGMPFKRSPSLHAPFARLKVSVKPEIVALGLPAGAAPPAHGDDPGMLSPQAWHALVQTDDVLVLDNRNHFEVRLGHFRKAVDPRVHNFRDFVTYVKQQAPAWRAAGRPVAMYCTGGIRCEKAAPWMRSLGLQVLQLEGGILTYLQQRQQQPEGGSAWQGRCFVFDKRMALDDQLQETATTAEQVFDARHPDEAWRLQRARRLQASGTA